MRSDLASPDGYGAQMSDLDEARRLLKAVEAKEISVYGGISSDMRIRLSTGWVAIANSEMDWTTWGGKDE